MKTEPHQKCSSRKPPVIGPRPMPSADTPAQMPIALPRSRGIGEDVGDDRQRRRHDERAADAHERAGDDQGVGRAGANADSSEPTPKIDRPMREEAVATEPVAEAPRGEQQAGEHERVGVDDPLQLAGRRPEAALR